MRLVRGDPIDEDQGAVDDHEVALVESGQGRRLVLAQVRQGEEGLPEATELLPRRVDLPQADIQQPGNVLAEFLRAERRLLKW
ncbi:hypothetical protein [Streptomyces sp. NPDC090135]|uniref:hypothetical protein n=1 Tax=Streptomyces sp. NPDC090135 TaxID=3365957 RepID=UPI003817FD86